MSDLGDLTDALKLEVAVPGEFATTFPNTTDDNLADTLTHAFARAQLDGWFGTMTLDLNQGLVSPDLSTAGGAVVVIYAAEIILQSKILSLKTRSVYEAGPTKYESDQSANVMVQVLKDLQARKQRLLDQAQAARFAAQPILMVDQYATRALYGSTLDHVPYTSDIGSYFFPYELVPAH